MQSLTWVLLCGVHSLSFAVFHIAFWRLFGWPKTLRDTSAANRIIIQILNLRITYVFGAMAVGCFAFTEELQSTGLGKAVLASGSLFWVGRLIEQFVFMPARNAVGSVLKASFLLGAILHALPVFS